MWLPQGPPGNNGNDGAPGSPGRQGPQGSPGGVTASQLAAAISCTANNTNPIATLDVVFSDPPRQREVAQVLAKVNELIVGLRREGRKRGRLGRRVDRDGDRQRTHSLLMVARVSAPGRLVAPSPLLRRLPLFLLETEVAKRFRAPYAFHPLVTKIP
jgi:hypothetical protein